MKELSSDAVASPAIPRGVWILGFVSMLMDMSSELVHSLLPLFMVSTLGASASLVGLIEGVAEATALITKVFSGALSDLLGKRKALTIFGYGLGALSKPAFALAPTISWVFAARFVDRVGKGMRGAPRDALVADLTPPEIRGAAYGLRQSLDTIGAFLGPLFAVGLMIVFAGDFRSVFWVAVIPGVLSVLLLLIGIREPEVPAGCTKARLPIHWRSLQRLSGAYWRVVAIGGVFTLARFSEAFLLLRARQYGVPDVWAPAVFILMNIVYAVTAYPAGKLADRLNRRLLLAAGLIVLMVSDLTMARASDLLYLALGVALWGLHMGLTQGLLATMVADAAPADLRGTAFGFFNLVSGVAMLAASGLAGLLWDRAGAPATFYAGAIFSVAALLLLALSPDDLRERPTA